VLQEQESSVFGGFGSVDLRSIWVLIFMLDKLADTV